jgi:hypothetical protein
MKLPLLALVFTLLACAPTRPQIDLRARGSILLKSASQIDPEFMDFVNDFVIRSEGQIGNAHVRKLSMQFANLEGSTIGVCYWQRPWEPYIRVEIDRAYWHTEDVFHQWSLIFHELGHCLCNREHTLNPRSWVVQWLDSLNIRHQRHWTFPDGCPRSVMNPTDFSSECVAQHQEEYIREIFSGCQPIIL